MEKLQQTFDRLRKQGRKALMPFIMAGDPDLDATRDILLALDEAGADVIEVGLPFSDPLADGPVIQAAANRALAAGTRPGSVLKAIAEVKPKLRAPIVLLTYWNPVLQFRNGTTSGPGAFLAAAAKQGVSGIIVPDLPVEEGAGLRDGAAKQGMAAVFLAAPTSSAERLRAIARASTGFVYYVSVTGTTGARRELPSALFDGIRQLKAVTTKPICVGFGISTPEQAATVAKVADGVIIGSALVQRLQDAGRAKAPDAARAFMRELRGAL